MRLRRVIGRIDGPPRDAIDNVKMRTFSYSFGVSRQNMKKIHVDEIFKKKSENLPGPDKYPMKPLFGAKQGELEGSSQQYSMRRKLDHFAVHLGKEKKRPGPGHYAQSNLVGGGISNSVMKNSTSSAFPKDGNRFAGNKFAAANPSPNKYHVKDGLNQNFSSTHSFAGQTVFGSNKKTFIDRDWKLDN